MQEALENIDELESYKGKWRNLWFEINGQTFLGAKVYETESICIAAAEGWISRVRKIAAEKLKENKVTVLCETDTQRIGRKVRVADITHFIPIPIGDA